MSDVDGSYQACVHCHRMVKITEANAVVYFYQKQPWFSLLEFRCTYDGCSLGCRALFGPHDYEMWLDYFVNRTPVGFVTEDFPPDDVVEWFEDNFDVHPLRYEFPELTPRQEKYVEYFHYLLEQGVME